MSVEPSIIPSVDNSFTFQGLYSPLEIAEANKSMLYFQGDNKLYWPNDSMTLGSFRAYFLLNGIEVGTEVGIDAGVKGIVINGGDTITGINDLTGSNLPEGFYDLSGRKLGNQKLAKGIYVNKGRKAVIK